MGLAVEGQARLPAFGEAGAVLEDRANRAGGMRSAASEQGIERRLKKDDAAGGERGEEFAGWRQLQRAAAEGENQPVAGGHVADGGCFHFAEGGLAMAGEDAADGEAGAGFHDAVGVDELPAEAVSEEGADSGLAGAHEAGEHDTG